MPLSSSINNIALHVRDMMNVWVKQPALYRQFADGFFNIAKTQNPFSMIGFDQNHEQQNKEMKMHGGYLNLSETMKSTFPAIDTKTATKESMWTAPRKICTY